MDQAIYTSLSRATTLKTELSLIANNIANLSTTGYRQESLIFSEYISGLTSNNTSVSMTDSGARVIRDVQGSLSKTDGTLDFAIDGKGFFQLESPSGLLISRAGHFSLNSA
ncbi:MAG: flagellar hook-basal body complex protein, partial [Dinoroseobacter sp.]|nr:flagellar hook-basal body complex protein [Dinoroseobacter sp.]